jgi:uncharacterized protein with ATP-grasp and redox domains
MKTYQACVPCITDLIKTTLDLTDLDDQSRQQLLDQVQSDLEAADLSLPPARIAGACYRKILVAAGDPDLFQAHKTNSMREAQKLYPGLKDMVESHHDPLDAAVRVSALGNILDVANPNSYDLDQEIQNLFEVNISGESLERLRTEISRADSLLLIADNAGEMIFDKVLIETLDLPVFYAVKSGPAFDDGLIDDARAAGIEKIANLIESGTPYPGTYLPSCSQEFQEIFNTAPLILAKGQANYETLNNIDRDLFFLLKVKCEVVSQTIGYAQGNLVLKYKQ